MSCGRDSEVAGGEGGPSASGMAISGPGGSGFGAAGVEDDLGLALWEEGVERCLRLAAAAAEGGAGGAQGAVACGLSRATD